MNGWPTRENTKGSTGKIQGLRMVRTPAKYAKIRRVMLRSSLCDADLPEVLKSSGAQVGTQDQVGTFEHEMPDIIIQADSDSPPRNELDAAPPILRPELSSEMKLYLPPCLRQFSFSTLIWKQPGHPG
jgi:hypothetical protein